MIGLPRWPGHYFNRAYFKLKDRQLSRLIGIAIRQKSRAAMMELERIEISTKSGLVGDFRGKPGARQVTVLSTEQWNEACAELGQTIPWTTRRANLLVEGLTFAHTKNSILRVGDVVLRISGETEPCRRMDEQVAGLRQALTPDWRGGVCCRVLTGGSIETGMQVTLEDIAQ